MRFPTVKSMKDLAALVQEAGILPFFANELEGYSLEECVDPRYYFPDEGEGVWEWKGPVIRETGCAYGKFFHGKAAYISEEWYADFAAWRRDGYDFEGMYEDGLVRREDKRIYDILTGHGSMLSKELKRIGEYRKGGHKGFDSAITRLQMSAFVVVSDFEYERDRTGKEYGWGVARYETPEKRFGEKFARQMDEKSPEEAEERVFRRLKELTGADEKKIWHFMAK